MTAPTPPEIYPQRAALVAGLSLLAMTGLGPFALFTVQGALSAGATPETLATLAGTRFVLASLAFLLIAALDIAAALALYRVFRPAQIALSMFAAALRITYAVALVMLTTYLYYVRAFALQGSGAALVPLKLFSDNWTVILGLFGLHLVVLGAVALKARYAPKLIGAVVILAGLGYVADAVGTLIGSPTTFAAYLFFGELVLMLWLFLTAWRPPALS
jgi:hypothetical protein